MVVEVLSSPIKVLSSLIIGVTMVPGPAQGTKIFQGIHANRCSSGDAKLHLRIDPRCTVQLVGHGHGGANHPAVRNHC